MQGSNDVQQLQGERYGNSWHEEPTYFTVHLTPKPGLQLLLPSGFEEPNSGHRPQRQKTPVTQESNSTIKPHKALRPTEDLVQTELTNAAQSD